MAQPTNSFSTYDAVGLREDLTDIIYNIDPTDTPFFTGIGKAKAKAVYHEWQTDSLAAVDADNAHIEGDDTTAQAITPTTRLGNRCQIFKKSVVIPGTQEAVDKAGRGEEMAYQIVKKTKELRRDIESALLANSAMVTGSDLLPRRLAGVPTWLTTNTSAGASGVDPVTIGTTARTDGTQRAFTETLLKAVLQLCWNAGGDPETVMVGSFNKQAFSGFTGGATRFDKSEDKKVTASVDVYVSDFGELRVVPNRFQRARDALVLQMDMWAYAPLRAIKQEPLAKTGDSEKRHIITEATMEARNEAASGIVADLTTA
jgi:hypothetical protein